MKPSIHRTTLRILYLCIVQSVLLLLTNSARAQAILTVDTMSVYNGTAVLVGSTAYDTINITNAGTTDLTLDSVYVTGNSTATYSVVVSPDTAIGSLMNDVIILAITPSATGSTTDTINIATNGGTVSLPVTVTGIAPAISVDTVRSVFDSARVRLSRTAYDTITITNPGTATLTIDTAYIAGQNSNQYTILVQPDSALAPDSITTLVVAYNPIYAGTYADTLYIVSNADTLGLPLTAVGITPQISISTSTVNFDTISVGQQSCRPIDIRNTGTDTLAITSNTLSTASTNSFYFYSLSGTDTLLAPGQTRAIGVCFIPTMTGLDSATIALRTNIPFDTTTRYITVIGTGAILSTATASSLSVPTAIIGATTCTTDTITAGGSTNPISITGITVTGADASAVQVTADSLPISVGAGQQYVYQVCVTPTHAGALDATIHVAYSSLGVAQSLSVPIMANALTACASANVNSLFTTRTFIGTTDTARVVVTNCGQVPSSYTAALPIGLTNYSLIGSAQSGTVQPGASTTFTFLYTPTGIALDTGNLMITGGLGVTPIVIPLNGSGGTVSIATTDTVPSVMVGSCQDFTIRLANAGNMNWTSGNVQITGTNAADFTASTFTTTTIGPDSTGMMTLRFCPSTVGPETATLTFPSAAPNANTQIVLNGTGLTSAAVAEGPAEDQLGITSIYPNPSSLSFSVSYYLPTATDMSLRLVDETGAAKDLLSGLTAAGRHDLSVDARTLPNGTYFLIMEAAGNRMVKQIKVVH